MKLIIIVLMLLVLGALLIISNNDLAFSDSENVGKFGDLFVEWADQLVFNLNSLTGNAVKLDWIP